MNGFDEYVILPRGLFREITTIMQSYFGKEDSIEKGHIRQLIKSKINLKFVLFLLHYQRCHILIH